MKKCLLLVCMIMMATISCQKYDDSEIWDKLNNHENRLEYLEEVCKSMNTDIVNLQSIITALEANDYIISASALATGDGYTFLFKSGKSVVIYNGKDGKDGSDGITPAISVKQDADGIYYWTVDGVWLIVDGEKVKAAATDGQNGIDGTDGVTPKFKIDEGYWYISYDNEITWEKLGKAVGEDGQDGATGEAGKNGDSFFKSVTQDENNVYLQLADGTTISIPLATSYLFNKLQSISYIPRYNDGAATLMYDDKTDAVVEMDFEVYPKTVLNDIYDNWAKLLSLKAVYTMTRSEVSFVDMPILSCSIDPEEGILSIKSSGENLSDEFFEGLQSANARLAISDEDSSISSAYIPLTSEKIKPNGNEIWYTTTDGKILSPNDASEINATIVSNVYENGKGVITFDKDITVIGTTAFNSRSRLTSINIPNTVLEVGWLAFNNCVNLTTVSLSKNLERIGDRGFSLCEKLVDLTLPSKLKSLRKNAFASCVALTAVHLPDSIEDLGDGVFYNCPKIDRFSGKFVYEDGKCIIYNETINSIVSGLSEFTVPDNVKHIGYESFRSMWMKTLTLNDKIESIGARAFFMSYISELRFPSTVTEIQSYAFASSSLKKCYFESVVPPAAVIPEGYSAWAAFQSIDNLVIYVPDESVELYKEASGWKNYADLIQGMSSEE